MGNYKSINKGKTINCLYCRKPFVIQRGNEKYCSESCRIEGKREYARIRMKTDLPVTTRVCRVCGKEFEVVGHAMNMTCSTACSKKWRNRYNRISECIVCGMKIISYNSRLFCSERCEEIDKETREMYESQNNKPTHYFGDTLEKLAKKNQSYADYQKEKTIAQLRKEGFWDFGGAK